MILEDLRHKTCLIGLSYFDAEGKPIKQNQLSDTVVATDSEQGISIALHKGQIAPEGKSAGSKAKTAVFVLPPALTAWYVAPAGHYREEAGGIDIKNPDFLVTWDIYQTKGDTTEGQHERRKDTCVWVVSL